MNWRSIHDERPKIENTIVRVEYPRDWYFHPNFNKDYDLRCIKVHQFMTEEYWKEHLENQKKWGYSDQEMGFWWVYANEFPWPNFEDIRV